MRSIGLPLLHEEEVEGVVSSVFVDIRARMPFVPALFKALAADPDSLVAAWLQARMIYDDPRSPVAADEIRKSAQVSIGFRPSNRVSEALAPYATELPFMLLIVTSLQLSLSGELARQPTPELDLPAAAPVPKPEFSRPCRASIISGDLRGLRHTASPEHLPNAGGKRGARRHLERDWPLPGQFRRSGGGRPGDLGSRESGARDARSCLVRRRACPTDTRPVLPRPSAQPDPRSRRVRRAPTGLIDATRSVVSVGTWMLTTPILSLANVVVLRHLPF